MKKRKKKKERRKKERKEKKDEINSKCKFLLIENTARA